MRKILIAGNWKMNFGPVSAKEMINELVKYNIPNDVDSLLCVPSISITEAVNSAKNKIAIGAQNMYWQEKGAFTGEISPTMLVESGVKHVIIGHSERREYFGETDDDCNKKIKSAIEHDIVAIYCVGEKLEQRNSGEYFNIVMQQIRGGMSGLNSDEAEKVVIAYEPVWAIGTGLSASDDDANEMCAAIRNEISKLFSSDVADRLRILYGGSVKPETVAGLLSKSDIDGALVGGASLKASDFYRLICRGEINE